MKKICNCEAKGKKNCYCNRYILLAFIVIILGVWLGVNKHFNNVDDKINTNKILVVGSGNEPGWNVKVYGLDIKQTNFRTDFILDYGDAKYSGILGRSAEGSIDTNFQFRGDVNLIVDDKMSSLTKNVILYFEKATCVDDSGATKNYIVELNLNSEKQYKGCGDLVIDIK